MTWEVQDDNGTIHSGTEQEMKEAFDAMTSDIPTLIEYYELKSIGQAVGMINRWSYKWKGDLKLVRIENIYR